MAHTTMKRTDQTPVDSFRPGNGSSKMGIALSRYSMVDHYENPVCREGEGIPMFR